MARRLRGLPLYMAAVSMLGLPVFVLLVLDVEAAALGPRALLLASMTALLIVGEMSPVAVPRGDDVGDKISISSTVALALMMLAPLGFVVAAQAVALTADEARSRRRWERLPFNIASYTFAVLAARHVYTGVLGYGAMTYHPQLDRYALPAALLGAAAFFVVNNTLIAVAVALNLRVPIMRQVVGDLRGQAPTSGVLLALGPVMAIAVNASPWTLPLLVLPLVAVHRSAGMAYAREHEALHDALTGLANRALFNRRLARACASAAEIPIAVLLVDLDHFKEINDTLGHQAGDLLLVQLAKRLRAAVREGDLVARLGGDEFAVITVGGRDEETVAPILSRLQEALRTSVTISGVRLDIGASLASRSHRPTRSTPTRSCRRLTLPCTPPSATAAAPRSTPPARTGTRSNVSRCSASFATRWRRDRSTSCTSPSSRSRRAGSWGSRPSHAGTTALSACSARHGSSPWPRPPA